MPQRTEIYIGVVYVAGSWCPFRNGHLFATIDALIESVKEQHPALDMRTDLRVAVVALDGRLFGAEEAA